MKTIKNFVFSTIGLFASLGLAACETINYDAMGAPQIPQSSINGFLLGNETVRSKYYPLNKDINFARIISVAPSINNNWQPKSKTDFPIPSPKSWESYKEGVNSYNFASNAAVMLGTIAQPRGNSLRPLLFSMATELDKIATETSIETPNGGLQIYNKFSYSQKAGPNYTDVTIPPGWGSAFANAFFANGYLSLYQMTNNRTYLIKAYRYLKGIIDQDAKQKLYVVDDNYLWFEMVASDTVKIRPYNGHIAVIASMLNFKKLTGSYEFDQFIHAGILTMETHLPNQIRPKGFFGYAPENPDLPDYGQERALNYSVFLCDLTRNQNICNNAANFRGYYGVWKNQNSNSVDKPKN